MQFSNPEVALSKPLPPCGDGEFETRAWGIENFGEEFKKLTIAKPNVGEHDVKIEMKFCGICHTDVHFSLNEMSSIKGKSNSKNRCLITSYNDPLISFKSL